MSTDFVDLPAILGSPNADARARPATVLQVLPALVTGGVERGTVDLAIALAQAGCNALIASAGGPMEKEFQRFGVRHITLPLAAKTPWAIRSNARALARLIEREAVDIIHARSRAPAWAAYYAARSTGCPLVTTVHGPYGAGSVVKRRYNAVMTKGARVIAISDFIARYLQSTYPIDPLRLRTVPRGIDSRRFDPAQVTASRVADLAALWRLDTDRKVVMLPGRLTRWKGQLLLIEALRRLGRRDLQCLLVGADQGRAHYTSELTETIARAQLGGIVRMVGDCRDMPAAYLLSDVVVSASTEPEAFGRVTVEAAAMGRTVVAAAHGGALETVIDGETGRLVPPSNPDALAAAIDEALNLSDAQRAVLGAAARAHVLAHFTTERMCAATFAIYRDILGHG